MKTILITGIYHWEGENKRILIYDEVSIYGQTDDTPEITFIGNYRPEETEDDYAHPELHDSSYHKLLEFAKLKYMKYFDCDDWNILFMDWLIEIK